MKKLTYIATLTLLSGSLAVAQSASSSNQTPDTTPQSQSSQPMSEQIPNGGNSTNPAPKAPTANVPDSDPSQGTGTPQATSPETPPNPDQAPSQNPQSSTTSSGGTSTGPTATPQDNSTPKTDSSNQSAPSTPESTTPH
jgi:hypothetical protein